MINRESGVFQTSYEGDMALYTLPLARNTTRVMGGVTGPAARTADDGE